MHNAYLCTTVYFVQLTLSVSDLIIPRKLTFIVSCTKFLFLLHILSLIALTRILMMMIIIIMISMGIKRGIIKVMVTMEAKNTMMKRKMATPRRRSSILMMR